MTQEDGERVAAEAFKQGKQTSNKESRGDETRTDNHKSREEI